MEFYILLILSLTTYRVTRFLLLDTLIESQRVWVYNAVLGKRPGAIRNKIHELITCKFCLSIWIAAGAVATTERYVDLHLPVFLWLASAAGSLVVWRMAEPAEVEITMGNVVRHKEAKYD